MAHFTERVRTQRDLARRRGLLLLGLTQLVQHLAGVSTPDFSLIFHAFRLAQASERAARGQPIRSWREG